MTYFCICQWLSYYCLGQFSIAIILVKSITLFSVVSKEDWESSLPEGSLEVEKKPEELPNTPVNKVVKRSTGVSRITILYLYINTIFRIYAVMSLVSHRSGRV